MFTENPAPGALGVQAGATEDRTARAPGVAGDVRQGQRLHVRVDARLRHGLAVNPVHLIGIDDPK